jgi:DNA-binding NtrC family response regulator
MAEGKILIVDDNQSVLSALKLFLQFEFQKVVTLSSPGQIVSVLKSDSFDVVLLDMNFSSGVNTGNEGLFWLDQIKRIDADIEVVMFTAYGDVELAVNALKRGAADFVLKPWENEKMLATLKSALRLRKSKLEINVLKKRETSLKQEINKDFPILVGSSPSIMNVMNMVEKVAKTEANVLITGENGTGKELIAREIHRKSDRSSELMVSVDMGAITETLFESELFGHIKGAFTDARQDRVGKFQLANKGTLFLDEIGNLPFALQSKLLTVLQNRTVVPVGSNQHIPVDIRLISATNCNITDMVERREFREDLLYRLNTIHVEVPPLRERGEDIELLATHFLKLFEKKYRKQSLKISNPALRKLTKHSWPGNVRELQHTIEKAVILTDSDILKPEDFIFRDVMASSNDKAETLDQVEKRMIQAALAKYGDNLTSVANHLGITRQTLYNKIKRYDR